jgi:hypothetical protein
LIRPAGYNKLCGNNFVTASKVAYRTNFWKADLQKYFTGEDEKYSYFFKAIGQDEVRILVQMYSTQFVEFVLNEKVV